MPRRFWTYLAFTMMTTTGFATFGVLGFHLATRSVVATPMIPIVYAIAMGVDAVAALASGWLYDRIGLRVLVAIPILSAIIPALAVTTTPALAVAGVIAWGAVLGVQESTMRAAVADLVPAARRGTAYGVFGAGFGVATLLGGVATGALYDYSIPVLLTVVAVIQAVALVVFAVRQRTTAGASSSA